MATDAASLRTFTLFEGLLMLVLGILALLFPLAASVWVTVISMSAICDTISAMRLLLAREK